MDTRSNDDILFVDKKTLVLAYQSLLWMIRTMEWANEQTGLDSGLSPELFKATQARDALRKVLSGSDEMKRQKSEGRSND